MERKENNRKRSEGNRDNARSSDHRKSSVRSNNSDQKAGRGRGVRKSGERHDVDRSKTWRKEENADKPMFEENSGSGKVRFRKPLHTDNDKPYDEKRPKRFERKESDRPLLKKKSENSRDAERKSYKKPEHGSGYSRNEDSFKGREDRPRKYNQEKDDSRKRTGFRKSTKEDGPIRLNKYISNSGICSRREADVMISTGVVKVNGEVITTMGYKVNPGDKVVVDGRELKSEKKVYLLLNKPKDTITTTDDPGGRNTVMDLIKGACRERIYPVGRLDRNTTGLILFTNDGDMAKRLMHPSHKIIKVYEATLDKNLTREDMMSIASGVNIDEEFVPIDGIAWPDPAKKNVVGLEIHSGAYHVVKRIFEQFGYKVIRLDRTMYGPLTKKNLQRGKWRFLNDDEISILHRL